jgi:hypothetical protein
MSAHRPLRHLVHITEMSSAGDALDATPFPLNLEVWNGMHMEGPARTWFTPSPPIADTEKSVARNPKANMTRRGCMVSHGAGPARACLAFSQKRTPSRVILSGFLDDASIQTDWPGGSHRHGPITSDALRRLRRDSHDICCLPRMPLRSLLDRSPLPQPYNMLRCDRRRRGGQQLQLD